MDLQDFRNKNVSIFDDLYLDASWALGSLYYSKLSLLLWGVIQYLLSSIWFIFDFLTLLSLSFSIISSHIGFFFFFLFKYLCFEFKKQKNKIKKHSCVWVFFIFLFPYDYPLFFSFLFFFFFYFFLFFTYVSLFFFVLRNAFSMGLYLELPTVSLPYFMDIKVRINPSRYFGN